MFAGAVLLLAIGIANLWAQGRGSGRTAEALFTALDASGNGTLTRSQMESSFQSWFTAWGGNNG
jgi:hypothetical protein